MLNFTFKNSFLLVFFFLFFHLAVANNNEPISSAEIGDASPFHVIKFDNGIHFGDPEDKFSLGMRFRMQNRADFINTSSDKFEKEWLVRRARLRLNGHVVDPRLKYLLQLSFTPRDQDWAESQRPNVLRDAMILFQVNESWQIGFGQGKLPGNRQRVVSSGDQQFIDRSIVNAAVNIDRDFGFQTGYKQELFDQVWHLRGAVTSGEGRGESVPADAQAFFVGRLEWLPFGEFDRQGDYFESDLAREPKWKASLGYSYATLSGAARANGTVGRIFFDPVNNELARRSQQVQFLDLILKKQGFSFYGEYARRDLSNPIVSLTPGSELGFLVGSGINLQLGYMFLEKQELAIRHCMIRPERESQSLFDNIDQWSLVHNYFVSGHRVKVQTEVGTTLDVEEFLRFQVELGI